MREALSLLKISLAWYRTQSNLRVWDLGLFWFCLSLLSAVIGPENTCHFLNQSNSSLKTNHDLVVCVFPRFRHFDSSEFPLASCHFNHFLDWPLWFVLFWFNDTQSKSALLLTISTIFVNRIRKMVGFELGKETKKDGFFSSCHEWGQRKTNHLSPFLHRAQNSLSFFPYLQNMTLSTLLILAVCRTRVIYKLRDRSRSPWSLSGLVIQHRSADFVGLCSTLVKRREKILLSFNYYCSSHRLRTNNGMGRKSHRG